MTIQIATDRTLDPTLKTTEEAFSKDDISADKTTEDTSRVSPLLKKYYDNVMTPQNALIAIALAATGFATYKYSSAIAGVLSIAASSLTQAAYLTAGFALANPILMGAIVLTTLALAIGGLVYYKSEKTVNEEVNTPARSRTNSDASVKSQTLSRSGSQKSLVEDEGNQTLSRSGSQKSLNEEVNTPARSRTNSDASVKSQTLSRSGSQKSLNEEVNTPARSRTNSDASVKSQTLSRSGSQKSLVEDEGNQTLSRSGSFNSVKSEDLVAKVMPEVADEDVTTRQKSNSDDSTSSHNSQPGLI